MIPYKWPVATAIPQNPEVRLEIAKAPRTLLEDDDERLRQRRAEIASIRQGLDEIAQDIARFRREAPALILSELRKHGYDPTEPRMPKGSPGPGRWTKDGIEIAQADDGPVGPLEPRGSTGISQIDDVTDKLKEILTKEMNALALLPGQPQKYGIIVHKAFAIAIMAAGIRGISPLDVERRFNLPPGYSASRKYVIPDAVLRNDIGDIIAIYDVKTGEETIEPRRARQLRAATGVGLDVPIIVLHPREVTLKCMR
jgi:hypothetical protein